MPKKDLKAQFGSNVFRYRTDIGMTQETLADKCDISVRSIRYVESGVNGAKFTLIEKLSAALGVTPSALFES